MKSNEAIYELDPLEQFTDVEPQRLIDAMGVLPAWVDPADPRPARLQFETKYRFGVTEIPGVEVMPDGTWSYPGDPVLHPIAKIERAHEIVYFYRGAFVAIVQKSDGASFATRMD